MLEKEVFDLKLLNEHSPIRFPKVIFSRKSDDIIPIDCYCMDLIDGKNACFDLKIYFKSKKKRKQFADKITTALPSYKRSCFWPQRLVDPYSDKNTENEGMTGPH